MSGVARFLVAFLLSLLPALSWAQTAKSDYSVLIDADRDPATGCSVALPTAGRVDGIERRLTATVTSPLQVASLTLESCVDGRFDAPVALPGAPFPVGLDTGIAGADVIELAAPSGAVAALGGTVRLYFAARGPSSDDLLATADGSPNGAPILFEISPVPIPTLAGWSLLLLGFLLAAIAASRHRRGAAHTLSVLSLLVVLGVAFAAGFVLDGRTDDWQGVSPTGADPTGDSAPSTDIGAGFAAEETGTLFFRVDVGDVEAPPSANQPPVFTSTPVTIANVASAYSYTIATSDPDGNALTLTAPTLPAWLTFTPGANGAGTLSGTPAAADAGSHPVALRVTDNGNPNLSANQAFTITVRAAGNGAPTATPQTLSTREDTALTITLTGSDPNNDPLTFALASNPASGALRGTAPNLTYTPNTNFNGSDRFTFTVSDGTATSAPATIAITVTPANDAPTATAQNLVTARDAALAITLTGSDPDNDPLSFAVATNPTNGTLSGTAPNLTYTPNTGFRGNDRFTFTVNDGTVSSAPATVSITVGGSNASPVANGQSLVTALNTVLAITLTGSDPDNDPLTFAIATTPANGALSGAAPNLTYTPTTGFTGTDSFTFTVDDGALTSAPATVVITVGGGNAPPVANGQSVSTLEDTDVAIVLTGADPDNDPLTFIIATNPTNGALSGTIPNLTYTPDANFNGADSFTFTVNDGTATSATATVAITVNAVNDAPTATAQTVATAEDTAVNITLAGTDPENEPLTFDVATNPTNGTLGGTAPNLTYTPNAGFNGADSFTFTVNDGTVSSPPATVSISVGAANDPPTANNQSVSTPEDAAVTITLTGSDPDGDNLTFVIGTKPANGTLGAITAVNATSARVTYTPSPNFTGPDSFTFTVNDGAATSAPATVTITVGVINDAPVLDLDGTADDPGGDINFAATFTEDAGPLPIVDPANLTVDDPDSTTLDSATITLTNRPNDAAETLAANTAGTGIAASYTAATGVLLLAGPDSVANFQTVLRTVTYNNTSQDPDPADRSVTFVVDDGAATSAPATATVTVNSANDAPVVNGATFTLAENSANGANVGAPITFTDPDAGQTHTFAITAGNTNNAFTINTTTGQITVATSSALDFETAPTFSLTVQVTDNGTPTLLGSATVTINLTDVNDPPVVNAATFSLPENSANSTAAGTVTFTDPDAGQTHTFAITAGNTGNAFTINTTTGQITVATSSALDFEIRPSFSLTVQVTDNGTPAQSDTATVTVNLTDVNEAPAANPQSVTTSEDTPVAITLTGSDPENQALSFALGTGPGNGVLSGTAPNLTYAPNASFSGADSFTFTVSDGINTSAAATVGITVNAINDPPTITGQNAVSTAEDTARTIVFADLTVTDPDNTYPTGFTLTASDGANYTRAGNAITPAPDFNGALTVPVVVNDGAANSNTFNLSVTVTAVNDAPVNTVPGAQSADEDVALVFNAVNSNLISISDVDVGSSDLAVTLSVTAGGTLTLSGAAGLTFSVGDGADDATMTFTGSLAAINTALDSLSFQPPLNATVSSTLTLTTDDQGNTGAGGALSDTDTVPITINPVNDAPVIANLAGDTLAYAQGEPASVIDQGDDANASDIDSTNFDTGTLTVSLPVGGVTTEDQLGIRNQGIAADQIGLSGANVTYNPGTGAVTIGSFSGGGAGGGNLVVTLNASADATAVSALLRNITYFNSNSVNPGTTARIARFVLTDGDGGASLNTDATITIALNDPPVVTTSGGTTAFTEDGAAVVIDNALTVTDTNDTDLESATVTITNPQDGAVEVLGATSCAGLAVAPGLNSLSITGTQPLATYQTCLRSVTYNNTSTGPNTTARIISFVANDGSANSTPATKTVSITAVNDAPSFTATGGDQTVNEDAGAQSVSGWATAIDDGDPELTQTLTFNVSNNNNPLFLIQPAINSSGTLTYTPAANANGTATITVTLSDDGSSTPPNVNTSTPPQTFTITVTAVNDAPSFTPTGNPPTVNEDAGAQSVAWATGMSVGPANEAGQTLTFSVSNNNNGLFSAQPAVSAAGTLTYTPANNANGLATVSVTLQDSGGTANGGDNDAGPVTFTITVNPVNDPPVAQNKSGFSAQANMKIAGLSGLLTGVTDPDTGTGSPVCNPTFTVGTVGPTTNPTGGTISNVNVNTGTFDFDPPPGVTGNVTFNYTVVDSGCPGTATSAPATITVNVTGPVIWFVNTAGGAGNGTLFSPFNSLGGATTAMGSNTNQRIFVFSGIQALGTGVTLPADGWLIGQGVSGASFDAVMGITPPASTIARPSIGGTQHPTIRGTVSMNGNNTNVRGLLIQPGSGTPALQATLAGPFTGLVVGDVPNITGTSARAVNLNNVSGTFTIQTVNASATDIGINLSSVNPSSGSFTVTGNGGSCSTAAPTCSGGTISNVTDTGIRLNNTRGVSLTRMRVANSPNFGLNGTTVTNLDINTSLFDGTHGGGLDEGAIYVTNWAGTGTITNSEILGGSNDTIRVSNTTGSLNRLTISGSTIRNNTGVSANHGLRFAHGCVTTPAGCGGAVMNLTVTGSTFRNNESNHIDIGANGLGAMDVVLTSNTFQTTDSVAFGGAVNTTFDHAADITFDFNGNTSTGSRLTAFNFFGSNQAQSGASMIGRFRNNIIGTAGVANSASAQGGGLSVSTSGGVLTMSVTGNTIRNYASSPGMSFNAGDAVVSAGTFNLTATGNLLNIDTPLTVSHQHGLLASMGNTSAGNVITACLDIGGAGLANNLVGSSNPSQVGSELRVRQRFSSNVRLPGFGGPDAAAAITYLAGRNTVTGAANVTATTQTPGTLTGGAACTQP